jgi:hypothetical protein
VKLVEISKMKSDDLHACLRMWIQNQDDGKPGFRFCSVVSGDRRQISGKRKLSESAELAIKSSKEKVAKSSDVIQQSGESTDAGLHNGKGKEAPVVM